MKVLEGLAPGKPGVQLCRDATWMALVVDCIRAACCESYCMSLHLMADAVSAWRDLSQDTAQNPLMIPIQPASSLSQTE